MDSARECFADHTNRSRRMGTISDVMKGSDVRSMSKNPIVFAMANPNQIHNVLAFPAIFRGVLDAYATDTTEGMKLAAAIAHGVIRQR